MADADAARPRPGRVPVAPKSSPAAPGLASYFSTLDPLAEPGYDKLQQLSALEQNGVLRDDAFRAASVVAHIWSSQALAGLARQGRRSAVARRIFVSTGKWFDNTTKSISSTTIRTGRALLRADVLSSYARYLARVGQPGTAEAAGASGAPLTLEQQLRRDEEDAEVVAVITQVLESLAALARDEPSSQHPQRVQKPAAAGASKAAGNTQPPAPPPPPSLGSELRSGLSRSQVLEHTAAALLRLAAAAPAEAPPPATAPPQQMWVHVTQATCYLCWSLKRLLSKKGWDVSLANWHALAPSGARTPPAAASSSAAADADAAEKAAQAAAVRERAAQVRPLLSGPCLQFFLCWALGCTRLTVEHVAGLGGEPREVVEAGADAAAELALQPRLLMRPLQPSLRPVAEDQLEDSCLVLAAASLAFQATVGGGGGDGGDGGAAGAATAWPRQQQQQQHPQQRACTTPYPPACVYDAVRSVLPGFCAPQLDDEDVDSGPERTDGTLLLVRLIGELPSRAAAARLPGLWRLLLLEIDCGLLSEMQDSLPKAARLLLPNELNARATAAAASGAVLLQPPPGLSYSLRCALDAGLLPTLERMLRVPDAWSGPCGDKGGTSGDDAQAEDDCDGSSTGIGGSSSSTATQMMLLLMVVLGATGVWPALLAHGPVHQLVSLIASLGAVCTNELLLERHSALRNRMVVGFALTSLLQQAVDMLDWGVGGGAVGGRAYTAAAPAQAPEAEGPQQAQQQLSKSQKKRLKKKAGGGGSGGGDASSSSGVSASSSSGVSASASASATSGTGTGIGTGTGAMDMWFAFSGGEPDTGPVTFPVMAAYGGAPRAGSAAAAQQALLVSFALQQWLPALMMLAAYYCRIFCRPPQAQEQAGAAAKRGSGGSDDDEEDGTIPQTLRLCAAVLRLLTRVAMRAAALAQAVRGAGGAGPSSGSAAPLSAQQQQQLREWGQELAGWESGVLELCGCSLTQMVNSLTSPALVNTAAGRELEGALLDAMQAYALFHPQYMQDILSGCIFVVDSEDLKEAAKPGKGARGRGAPQALKRKPTMALVPATMAKAAERQGRRPLSAFLDSTGAACSQLWILNALDKAVAGAAGPSQQQQQQQRDPAIDRKIEALSNAARALVEQEAAALWRALCAEGGADWRRRWEAAGRRGSGDAGLLLSPEEVRARLREAGVVMGSAAVEDAGPAGVSGSGSGGSAAAAPGGLLCGSPICTRLRGPSALVPPGAGVGCPHCRQVTYCCAQCRQQHWGTGRHGEFCVGVKAAAGEDTPAARQWTHIVLPAL